MRSISLSEEFERLTRQSNSIVFLEYYCDNKDNRRNSATAILRGLIYQLLKSRSDLFKHIISDFQIKREKLFTASSFPSLWKIFRDMLQDPGLETVYCVLDGLDECEEDSSKMFLSKLPSLFVAEQGSNTVCHLKMIILSRAYPGFLPEAFSTFPCIALDLDADVEINHDIKLFMEDRINELSKLRRYLNRLSAHVKDVFRKRAQGTFLWIGIAARELVEYPATEVEEALKHFPSGLEPLFSQMLLQIKPERRQTVAQILRWVVLAARPLTVLELSIAVKRPDHDHDHARTVPFSREEVMRNQILSCGFLLNITQNTVNLIHKSAKNYLLRKVGDSNSELDYFRIKEDEGNLQLAKRCFYYLQTVISIVEPRVENPQTSWMISTRRKKLQRRVPLLSYAVQHWPVHASALTHRDDIFDVSHRFYQDPKLRAIWREMYFYFDGYGNEQIPLNTLHIAAYFNLKVLSGKIISTYRSVKCKKSSVTKEEINEPESDGSTALHLAANRGYIAMSQLLLENEAHCDARDVFQRTTLHVAVKGEHMEVVQMLLNKGASIEARDSFQETPLHSAARSENIAVVRLLLGRGAFTDAENIYGITPLHITARSGKEEVLKLLLNGGSFKGAKKNLKMALLHDAAKKGHPNVVRVLLLHKENTNFRDCHGWTALHHAVQYKNEEMVELLLKNGTHLEMKCKKGETPLHKAAKSGFKHIARVLLDGGALINAQDNSGCTAVHYAARENRPATLRELFARGASTEIKSFDGLSALQVAVQKFCLNGIITQILNHQNNSNANERGTGEASSSDELEYGDSFFSESDYPEYDAE